MNHRFIQNLLNEPDKVLTENGLQLKRLAEKLQVEDYELTEQDKEILDQKWRKIWKDKPDEK